MSDEKAPEATEGTAQTKEPLPNTVCVANDLFSGTLDVLAYDSRTKFTGGTALVIDSDNNDAIYNLAICFGDRHVHLLLGLACELGKCSMIIVTAYAFALAYDREHWCAGCVPSREDVRNALRDCIAVLRERATDSYANWLAVHCEPELIEWYERFSEAHAHDGATTTIEA